MLHETLKASLNTELQSVRGWRILWLNFVIFLVYLQMTFYLKTRSLYSIDNPLDKV